MEFPEVGKRCAVEDCEQLDFLPIPCDHCQLLFCKEHYHTASHKCRNLVKNVVTTTSSGRYYVCSEESCKDASPIEMPCIKCRKHFCLTHRYHGCLEISNDEKARKLKKWQIPKQQFAEAKAAADQEVSDNLKRSKNTAMANKVRLMRVKGSASGPKKVPMNERCYFLVYPPLAVTNKFIKPSKAVYISSNWTVGKIIDSIADTLKIINNNNNPNECKLRLFHFVTGAVICNDMGTPVKQLFDDNELVDGQSVILEYSDNTSVDSSLYK